MAGVIANSCAAHIEVVHQKGASGYAQKWEKILILVIRCSYPDKRLASKLPQLLQETVFALH